MNLIIIVILLLLTGFLIYYLYLKPQSISLADIQDGIHDGIKSITNEPFADGQQNNIVNSNVNSTSPNATPVLSCPQITTYQVPTSIVSRFFGIGFNIYPVNGMNGNNVGNSNATTGGTLVLIEHIPIVYNNTLGSMYAISSDGQLTIKLRNEQDPSQWWNLTSQTDSTGAHSIITPFSQNVITPMALQYENGNLALRPYNAPGFESQKWITSTNKVTRGIPVLNYNPASMFSPEFDPYSTTTNLTSSSLTQQNNQQVNDVISAIKSNIQQYLTQIGSTQTQIPNMSSSSLGNKEMPLNINLNLGGSSSTGGSTLSSFANLFNTDTPSDVLSLLDKYESKPSQTQYLYDRTKPASTDLTTAMNSGNTNCQSLNIGDYTSSRVSSCNCNLE